MNTTPKEVQLAVRVLALAVKIVNDMAERPTGEPQSEYHSKEYLDGMEAMLLEQVLTAFPDERSRREFLAETGLSYLTDRMVALNRQWDEES